MGAWVEELKAAGDIGPKTIRNVHAVLSIMLQQARFEGLVSRDGTGVPRLPGRRAHSPRRSFISLARSDGARQDVLERITHNSAAAMIDAYTWMGWDALCEAVAVAVLRVERLEAIPEDAVAHSPEPGGGAVAGWIGWLGCGGRADSAPGG